MNAATVSLVNATALIGLGLWGYLSSDTPSPTALIPVGFGVVIALCNPGVRRENRTVAHLAVVLTLLICAGLIMPMRGAIGRSDGMALARVLVMFATSLAAMVFFVKSFREARRRKAQG